MLALFMVVYYAELRDPEHSTLFLPLFLGYRCHWPRRIVGRITTSAHRPFLRGLTVRDLFLVLVAVHFVSFGARPSCFEMGANPACPGSSLPDIGTCMVKYKIWFWYLYFKNYCFDLFTCFRCLCLRKILLLVC
jgi:hypothetical protein